MSTEAKVLWLARDKCNIITLLAGDMRIIDFHARTAKLLCPSFSLDPGEKCKVKLTQTDKGIRLERL